MPSPVVEVMLLTPGTSPSTTIAEPVAIVVAGSAITASLLPASFIVPALSVINVESRSAELLPAATVYVPLCAAESAAGPVIFTTTPVSSVTSSEAAASSATASLNVTVTSIADPTP